MSNQYLLDKLEEIEQKNKENFNDPFFELHQLSTLKELILLLHRHALKLLRRRISMEL